MDVITTLTGPLFTGTTARRVDAAVVEAETVVADRAVNLVRDRLSHVLQHPTGYYESQIQTKRETGDRVVTDGGVIYGPWLEGVGSRNHTTRFKGYATFRLTSQQVDREAGSLIDELIAKAVE